MSKTLLVGAGAECIEPFGLLAGKEFTFDTCYYQNEALYEALGEFYRGRLSKSVNRDLGTPSSYQNLFLYSSKNVAFRKLSNYIVSASKDSFLGSRLSEHIIKSQDDDEENRLDTYGRDLLFDMLIKRDKDAGYVSALKEVALEVIPDDAYYGTIETYFSSLINPTRRSKSLWRLINYYWSAFFSVAEPLIRKAFENDRLFKQQGLYRFTLNNINTVIDAITTRNQFTLQDIQDTYYARLRGKFDNVLTTNYTGLSDFLFPELIGNSCVYLSGALWLFESLGSLTSRDVRKEPIAADEFVFPFLMTQVPIKPIIDTTQLRSFSKAIEILDNTDLLVVLGYSFCESDSHISAMVRDFMQHSNSRLIYLDYSREETPSTIKKKLRLNPEHSYNIDIFGTGDSDINRLIEILNNA